MDNSKAKIIIVEEEEQERRSLGLSLEAEGYSVSLAGSAADALEIIKRQFFDILLVDFKLPDMNGIELIKHAIAVSKESVPVVITGFGSLEVAVESMRIGAHDYIVKPINTEELKKNIENIIIERDELLRGRGNVADITKKIEAVNEEMIIAALSTASEEAGIAAPKGFQIPGASFVRYLKRYFWDID